MALPASSPFPIPEPFLPSAILPSPPPSFGGRMQMFFSSPSFPPSPEKYTLEKKMGEIG